MNDESIDFFNSGIRICLEIGTQLHIEIETVSIPLQSDFIGMEPDKYLIISAPRPFAPIKHKLSQGNQVIVKYLYKGTVYAFQTKIIEATSKPVRLVFLEYPKIVQHKDIRNHKRMSCFIPVKIIINDEKNQGAILDINKQGCRCRIQNIVDLKSPSININDQITLKFPFPGIEGELTVLAKVTNMQKNKKEVDFGAMFHQLPIETQKIISQYILSVYDFL